MKEDVLINIILKSMSYVDTEIQVCKGLPFYDNVGRCIMPADLQHIEGYYFPKKPYAEKTITINKYGFSIDYIFDNATYELNIVIKVKDTTVAHVCLKKYQVKKEQQYVR